MSCPYKGPKKVWSFFETSILPLLYILSFLFIDFIHIVIVREKVFNFQSGNLITFDEAFKPEFD